MVMSQEDSHWLGGFAPSFGNWLNSKGWNDKPYKKPQSRGQPHQGSGGEVASYQGMRINSVAQGVTAENDAMARRLIEKRRIEENENAVAITAG